MNKNLEDLSLEELEDLIIQKKAAQLEEAKQALDSLSLKDAEWVVQHCKHKIPTVKTVEKVVYREPYNGPKRGGPGDR